MGFQNNNHHVTEKIAALEKEKRELADRLKKESETTDKLKKASTELSVARAAAQAAVSDLNDKVASLTEDRNLLERETAKLQSQLQLEKNHRGEAGAQAKELQGTQISSSFFIHRRFSALCMEEMYLYSPLRPNPGSRESAVRSP